MFSLDSSILDSSVPSQPDWNFDLNSFNSEDYVGNCGVDSDGEIMFMNRSVDVTDDSEIRVLLRNLAAVYTLGSKQAPCSNTLPKEYAIQYRCQCMERSRVDLDIAILGQLAALQRREPTIAIVSDQAHEKKTYLGLSQFFDLEM